MMVASSRTNGVPRVLLNKTSEQGTQLLETVDRTVGLVCGVRIVLEIWIRLDQPRCLVAVLQIARADISCW